MMSNGSFLESPLVQVSAGQWLNVAGSLTEDTAERFPPGSARVLAEALAVFAR